MAPRRFRWYGSAMKQTLIMTILGPDRSGLVRLLADTVAAQGGNWLESRMARLAGQFAGIACVECPPEKTPALRTALQALCSENLAIQLVEDHSHDPARPLQSLRVDVVGNDRPGILLELTAAIATAGGNIEELTTGLESAAMAGHPLFRATGSVSLAAGTDPAILTRAIETLGGDLSVHLS